MIFLCHQRSTLQIFQISDTDQPPCTKMMSVVKGNYILPEKLYTPQQNRWPESGIRREKEETKDGIVGLLEQGKNNWSNKSINTLIEVTGSIWMSLFLSYSGTSSSSLTIFIFGTTLRGWSVTGLQIAALAGQGQQLRRCTGLGVWYFWLIKNTVVLSIRQHINYKDSKSVSCDIVASSCQK